MIKSTSSTHYCGYYGNWRRAEGCDVHAHDVVYVIHVPSTFKEKGCDYNKEAHVFFSYILLTESSSHT